MKPVRWVGVKPPYMEAILLTSLVVEYHQVQQNIKELEARKKALKAQIDLKLSAMGENKYEDSQFSAVMSESQRVKYDLEALEIVLEQKGVSLDSVQKTSISLDKVEDLVARGVIDPMDVANCAEVRTFKTLTVKKTEG
jgi:anion-transporting  ArsA/GET3 family ATPase